tara:strand:- start:1266 stop:1448 length:183 start_codon:yes stop_codon:yes gene_type:complete
MKRILVYATTDKESNLIAEFQYESVFRKCEQMLKEECKDRSAQMDVYTNELKVVSSKYLK